MRRLSLALWVMGLYLSACSEAPKAAKTPEPAGTYSLFAINGNALPYTPPHEGGAPQVRSSVFTLNADQTFSMTMTYGDPSGNAFSRDFSGTYTLQGSVFTFQWKGAGTTTATIEGNTFTMDNEGVLFAYRK